MGRLLDDDVLFSGGNGSVDRDPARDKNDALSTLLKWQTQAFRNAGQRGDVAEMKRYLMTTHLHQRRRSPFAARRFWRGYGRRSARSDIIDGHCDGLGPPLLRRCCSLQLYQRPGRPLRRAGPEL